MLNVDKDKRRWQRSRWKWSTPLFTDASGIHLQMQKILQSTSLELVGVPDHWKGIYRSTQNWVGQRREGKKRRRVSTTEPVPSRWGSGRRSDVPISGQSVGTKGKHLRLSESEGADL